NVVINSCSHQSSKQDNSTGKVKINSIADSSKSSKSDGNGVLGKQANNNSNGSISDTTRRIYFHGSPNQAQMDSLKKAKTKQKFK
ncbi:MAG: hypothetical protein ACHQRM_04470, partial [Bacteroidia bacterium]